MKDAVAGGVEFSGLLAGYRVRAGLTQEELAERSGVSLRALGDMERGRTRGPQRRTVQALAATLGLDAADALALERAAQSGRPRGTRATTVPAQPTRSTPSTPNTANTPSTPSTARPGQPAKTPEPAEPPAAPVFPGALALPRDIADFTAREEALARLGELVREDDPAHPRVVLISGQPGLGKTAFALHAAHSLADRFPDGRLSLDLAGMAPTPLAARDALGQVLRALGVDDGAVPAGTEERAGLFRALVRERRIVLVLDNAAD
ncbi:helix-turn-helix domain-containing protein, partial [Kitasatospora sp. NPDC093558]|uniref:helix-turn-helix domain-containing protein n=1 Tax=Kitasatospora sp. NPDC093558 TaxID=3155201 RepID=UPI0034192208